MKSQPTCRAFANTHSACPYRFFPFTECAHCRSLPPQVPLSVLFGPRVLQPLPADAWSDHSVFFCLFFPYFPFYRDIGFSFPSPVHALISDGWVQPSQPTPNPTLSSSLSVYLLTHAMSSLSCLHIVPIALSAVAMFLLCFWNELIASGLKMKHIATASHSQPFNYQAVQGSSLRGWSSYDHCGPSSVLMDFGTPQGRARPKEGTTPFLLHKKNFQ